MIDDADLDAKLSQVRGLLDVERTKEKELLDIFRNLTSIKKLEMTIQPLLGGGINATEATVRMELPIDKTTGMKITEARRTTVFTEQKRRLTAITTP